MDARHITGLDETRLALLREWMDAVASQEPQGECPDPNCVGQLRAVPADVVGGVVYLEADCDECGRAVVSPNGRRAEPAARRRGPLAQVHQVVLRSNGPDGTGVRVPDWRERAIGGDF